MPVCAVVDACSISIFQHERIANVSGIGTKAIDHIFSVGHIALDEGNFIREQWLNTASGSASGLNILDWIADRMQENKIRLVTYPKTTPLNKALSDYGMDLSDKVYVFVAVAGAAKMIVSEDVDFHDPTKKKASGAEKDRIKKTKCGPVCIYLSDSYGINIGDLTEVPSVLI